MSVMERRFVSAVTPVPGIVAFELSLPAAEKSMVFSALGAQSVHGFLEARSVPFLSLTSTARGQAITPPRAVSSYTASDTLLISLGRGSVMEIVLNGVSDWLFVHRLWAWYRTRAIHRSFSTPHRERCPRCC